MQVNFVKLNQKAQIPKKAHPEDAGFDLVATSKEYDNYGNVVYGTGLALEIPNGYAGLVFPRSKNSKMQLILTNSVGLIDSPYRGEILLKFRCETYKLSVADDIIKPCYYHNEEFEYQIGDRIGQLVIIPYPEIQFNEVQELTKTDRGNGGFGSTGN